MRRTYSDWLVPVLLGASVLASPLAGQDQGPPGSPIISSDIAVSQDAAVLTVELSDGRTVSLSLDDAGAVLLNGDRIGAYDRRDALDQAWRSLLQQAMDAPTGTLADVLRGWEPPADAGGVARRLDRELEAVLRMPTQVGEAAPNAPAADAAEGQQLDGTDSIRILNQRIAELERLIQDPNADASLDTDLSALRDLRRDLERDLRDEIRNELREEIRLSTRGFNNGLNRPIRYIVQGLGGVFSTLMVYGIFVGLGFLAVFFGRTYLEGVADTARYATLRSGLVGLAGSFLVLPAYILGALALAISIVGIPLLLVFLPLFPVAVVLGAVLGYLAVAHGAGEALAERRFTGTDWFTRANSYYYVITGLGLLMVLFIAAHIISMAGPWLGFIEGLLQFMAVVVTWVAFTIGLGAVLISRGGTRPVRGSGAQPSVEEDRNA